MTTPRESGTTPQSTVAGASADGASVAGPAGARPAARAGRFSSTTVLLVVSALIALGGVGFAVGRSTGGSGTGTTTAANQNGFPGLGADASGRPGFGAGGPGGAALSGVSTVTGTVVSATADSITIQLASGQTVTVATGSSTSYHNQVSANSADVATGSNVIVQTSPSGASASGSPSAGASANADGTVGGTRTATDVTITGN